jgi:hypothetical protein
VIPERADDGICIVLLDEVETLAADRQRMSLEANPIDVHRATDAALAGIDLLARVHRNALIIATTNFPEAVDRALMSRADWIEEMPLPDSEIRAAIIDDTIDLLSREWPRVAELKAHTHRFVEASAGMDGRAKGLGRVRGVHDRDSARPEPSPAGTCPCHDEERTRGLARDRTNERRRPEMKVRRDVASTPVRSASETWTAIIELIRAEDSVEVDQLERAASVMESLIADEQPSDAPIIIAGHGPRLVVYCSYGADAMEMGTPVDPLTWNPTAGDAWRLFAPCATADLSWMQRTLGSRAPRLCVYDSSEGAELDKRGEGNTARARIEIDWARLEQR